MQIPRADQQHQTGLFVRLPEEQARLLDRAAAAVPAHKKDLISGLLARHVDPDSPEGVAALRELTVPRANAERQVIAEGDDPRFQRGFGSFSPAPVPEVLDPSGAAELLDVDVQTLIELAVKGEIPGRQIGDQWRFARQGLLDWLART
jgi:excisionase family DNA binding protein